MISAYYKKIYDEFIEKYEEIHVCPWHEISRSELDKISAYLIDTMDISDEYSFKYFIDFLIKRLSGATDAHTKYPKIDPIPLNFRIFGDDVLVNWPDELRGGELIAINDVATSAVTRELENIITYGTDGWRRFKLEEALFNKFTMFGLPSFRKAESLTYKIRNIDGKICEKTFQKIGYYSEIFDRDEYYYGNNAKYRIVENRLIYHHTSCNNCFKEAIERAINQLRAADLSKINKIIVDIRGNTGGNASLNQILMDFLAEQRDKELICLTDYRVFSGGRFALRDLLDLGATAIGEEIGTPLNCFGNSKWINLDEHYFSISERYFNPILDLCARDKAEYLAMPGKTKESMIFHPEISVSQAKADYLCGKDIILARALEF